MNYHNFPSHRPDEGAVIRRVATVVTQYIRPSQSIKHGMVDFNTIDELGRPLSIVLTAPENYAGYITSLLYRRFALALLLHHNARLEIKPYKLWVVLAQNFLHVDALWVRCITKSDKSHALDQDSASNILDTYIITEAVVRRHEPVYVSEYRRVRTPEMPNTSQASLDDISKSIHRDH